ncbi:glycosyltransferase family 4 protein [Candidatus Gottesmanbacteria bacterium]|nr:glycosyltransferase family 4 protein [Candidatus Gottesmanbacteria bacterium]
MHIALDITPLKSGHKDRGIGSYTGLLIEALEKYECQHSYSFFTRRQKLPKDADLVHYPYFDPFFLTLPLLKPKPVVVTVHDLIPLAYPSHFPRGIRGDIKWRVQKFSLKGARRIITDSIASKRDIETIAGFTENLVDVVHLAPAEIFHPITDRDMRSSVQKKYSLPDRFILYVGDVNWNKNILGLLRAKPKGVALVLVGKAFRQEELVEVREINALIHALHVEGEVIQPGFVPDEDLAALYSLASAYIQPSFAEGFGLPVLESMACGCPVICARGSSLDEIAGSSLRVNASDISSIMDGIFHVEKLSTSQRTEFIQKGYAWVKRFSWKKVAAETAAVYEKALAGDRVY